MGEFDLNLSTRPFRSYRAINAMLIVGLVALTIVSAIQFYGYRRYTRLANGIRSEVRNAQVESEALRRQLDSLNSKLSTSESSAKLSEVGFLNGLIARKNFSWTKIFARLEALMPDGVRLVGLVPNVTSDNGVVLRLEVIGRSSDEIAQFADALQMSPAFAQVTVSMEEKAPGANATEVGAAMTASYYPEKDAE